MKDFVLHWNKEYNITAIIEKLNIDLKEYKDKLLSVAINSSDTCYIECFQRKI